MLIRRLILEDYGPDIEYIQGDKKCSIRRIINIPPTPESSDCTRVHLEKLNSVKNQ